MLSRFVWLACSLGFRGEGMESKQVRGLVSTTEQLA
jgi:hypothetical protein